MLQYSLTLYHIKALWADLALEILSIWGIVAHVIFSEICIGLPCSIAAVKE